jgi:hypothetical protein
MHNGIGFDAPVLRRVWGIVLKPSQVIDTLCMSRLYRPDIEGGHSLKAWGQRLRGDDGKIDFTDFDGGLCDEMVTYCKRDVDLTWELYRHLSDEMNKMGFSQQSIDLEHAIFVQMAKQERNGFLLDMRKATELLTELKNRMSVIEDELQETFPPIVTERWSEKTGKRLKDNVEVFNVGSRQQVAKRLESLGVKWKRVTETGRPVVDEGTLSEIDLPEAKLVAEFLMLQKRVGLVSNEWTRELLEGDIHTKNQLAAGLPERNMAKTMIYATLYGAGAAKIGSIVGGGAKEGEQILENFYANTPALRQLQARVGRLAQNGTIKGLDGRRLHIRSERAVLNTLLQSCGAIIAKQWCVEIHKELLRQGLTAHVMQCAFVHDEIQMAVKEKYCEIVAKIMVDSAAKAGVELDFRVKVDAEAKTGSHWADTH